VFLRPPPALRIVRCELARQGCQGNPITGEALPEILRELLDAVERDDGDAAVLEKARDEGVAPVVGRGIGFRDSGELAVRDARADTLRRVGEDLGLHWVAADGHGVEKAAGAVLVAIIEAKGIAGLSELFHGDAAL
jgi:hypothetical protein